MGPTVKTYQKVCPVHGVITTKRKNLRRCLKMSKHWGANYLCYKPLTPMPKPPKSAPKPKPVLSPQALAEKREAEANVKANHYQTRLNELVVKMAEVSRKMRMWRRTAEINRRRTLMTDAEIQAERERLKRKPVKKRSIQLA